MILFLIFRPLKKIIFAAVRIVVLTLKDSIGAVIYLIEKTLSITDWVPIPYAWLVVMIGATFSGAGILAGLIGHIGFLIGGVTASTLVAIYVIYSAGIGNHIQGPSTWKVISAGLTLSAIVTGLWFVTN
tara:strand:- start:1435 stop:1821 length:387 start_codon:yes stop_codon:yes gene_type:complete